MNDLIVGDLHAMPSNLEDTGLILDLILDICLKQYIENIIFVGDIFHTHSVVRQEAAHFVRNKVLNIARAKHEINTPNIYMMAGNHDGASPDSVQDNAVRLVFDGLESENIYVVDDDVNGFVTNKFFMVPFIGDNQRFIEVANKQPDKILVCHQTVLGAHYENKTLAPGGVDQNLLLAKEVIAGHIHMKQNVGKVFYIGTPRALNANEHNESKGIWLRSDDGKFEMVSTDTLVKRYIRYDILEGKTSDTIQPETWKQKDDVRICITGSEAFYKATVDSYKELNGRVRFIPNIRKNLDKKVDVESKGSSIDTALKHYVHNIYDASDDMREKVWNKIQELTKTV